MVPPPLQYEFLPRRRLPWLRPALAAAVTLCVALVAAWWWSQEQDLSLLRRQADAARMAGALPASASDRAGQASWQVTAQQDQSLFDLPLDARLLEIERCTNPNTIVTRFAHDAATGSTTVELLVNDTTLVTQLLGCLNVSDDSDHPWHLSAVEFVVLNTAGAVGPQQRVILIR